MKTNEKSQVEVRGASPGFLFLGWIMIFRIVLALVVLVIGFGSAYCPAASQDLAESLAAHDRAVHLLDDWMRDPYVVLVNGWYYLTCTRLTSIAGGKEGIQCWRSRDLVEWRSLGVTWTFEDSAWLVPVAEAARKESGKAHLWAPELHFLDGRWVAVHTTSFHRVNLLTTTGDELEPPFAEPMGPAFGHRHDPSIFTDDDAHWLIWACAKTAPLKPDMTGFAGPKQSISPSNRKLGHEGCLIRKIAGKYVLFGTAWSTDQMRKGTYNLYYCISDKVTGPYGPRKFAARFCGHGTPFQDKQGRWWTTAFLNGRYVTPQHVAKNGTDPTRAETIVKQGLTLVPLDVRVADGDIEITAKDPDFAKPGHEEIQKF